MGGGFLKFVLQKQVKANFTEPGTSPAAAKAMGDETGVRVIQLTIHALPPDGSYLTFMYNLSNIICNGIR